MYSDRFLFLYRRGTGSEDSTSSVHGSNQHTGTSSASSLRKYNFQEKMCIRDSGGELKDVLREVKVLTPDGEVKELPAEELQLGYRTIVIPEKGYIVLEAILELKEGKPEEIKAVMEGLKERRIDKQPLEYPLSLIHI